MLNTDAEIRRKHLIELHTTITHEFDFKTIHQFDLSFSLFKLEYIVFIRHWITWADPEWGQEVRTPPTGIARLLIFAMLKYFPSDPFWEFGPPPP